MRLNIIHCLLRRIGPAFAFRALNIAAEHSCGDHGLHQFRQFFRIAVNVTAPLILKNRALYPVAEIIGEHRKLRKLHRILLHCAKPLVKRTCATCPALSVKYHGRVYSAQLFRCFVQRLDIQKSHQVKPEAVKLVFFSKIAKAVHDETACHNALARKFIPAGRAVGQAAVRIVTVKVPRERLCER